MSAGADAHHVPTASHRFALAAAVTVTALLATALPAQAATFAPATRAFGSVIDAPATWERESGCDQTEKKGPKRLRTLLTATFGLVPSNILRPCTAADSGHEEGRALDWMVNSRVPEQKAMAEAFLGWLQAPDVFGNSAAMARRLGVSYAIYDNAIWNPSANMWKPYRDCAKPKMRGKKWDNACHRNHVHVSFSWDGALGRTSFYTGFVACPAPFTDPWTTAVLPASAEVVPVAPVRVLDSKAGVGTAAGPCRVRPDVRVDLPVLGVGAVPAAGVAAVTLRIAVSKADAPAELRVWTAGTALPAAAAAVAAKKVPATVDVAVPVGPEGLVSLQLAGGMAHVTADVVGWSPAA